MPVWVWKLLQFCLHFRPVSNPILFHGRLLENDWGIEHHWWTSWNMHLAFRFPWKNYGKVRQVERVKTEKSIRAMQIKVPPVRFTSCPLGWSSFGGLRVCHTLQKTFVNPQDDEVALTFPFRTTLMKFDFVWKVHELSEDWRQAERERTAQTLQWEVQRVLDHHEKNINEFDVLGITFVFRRWCFSRSTWLQFWGPSHFRNSPGICWSTRTTWTWMKFKLTLNLEEKIAFHPNFKDSATWKVDRGCSRHFRFYMQSTESSV